MANLEISQALPVARHHLCQSMPKPIPTMVCPGSLSTMKASVMYRYRNASPRSRLFPSVTHLTRVRHRWMSPKHKSEPGLVMTPE
jgi:hypothetical protein